LIGAKLTRAFLIGVDLEGANLTEANLAEAELIGATLVGVNLKMSIVTDEQLARAKTLEGATMSDGKVYDPAIHTEIARLRKEAGVDQEPEQRDVKNQ
jgi:uncharacterized protein YjbI with pentapeptide repeats